MEDFHEFSFIHSFIYSYVYIILAEEASQDFEDFLDVLGERVRLKGWDRFRGGLDVKGKTTTITRLYVHKKKTNKRNDKKITKVNRK